jgi:parvulin-like peptidyl-prolyl isomerase
MFRPAHLLLALPLFAITACGSSPPPAAPAEPSAAPVAPPPPPAATAKVDTGAVDRCFAAANYKPAKFSGEPAKVGVKHILVKYKGAKNAAAEISRSRGEACLRAQEAIGKLKAGDDWDAVVKAYSEEAGAATRGGSMGSVERKDLVKPFADAAFALSVNNVSDVVETEFGFHVIFRNQ